MSSIVFAIRSLFGTGREAIENRKKHGISFETACEAFFDDYAAFVDATGGDERRMAVIGLAANGALLFVVHIEREDDQLRVTSAREATRRERTTYENG